MGVLVWLDVSTWPNYFLCVRNRDSHVRSFGENPPTSIVARMVRITRLWGWCRRKPLFVGVSARQVPRWPLLVFALHTARTNWKSCRPVRWTHHALFLIRTCLQKHVETFYIAIANPYATPSSAPTAIPLHKSEGISTPSCFPPTSNLVHLGPTLSTNQMLLLTQLRRIELLFGWPLRSVNQKYNC